VIVPISHGNMRSLGVHRLFATLPPAIARKPPSGLRAREMKVTESMRKASAGDA
jgi:hypothetical protein